MNAQTEKKPPIVTSANKRGSSRGNKKRRRKTYGITEQNKDVVSKWFGETMKRANQICFKRGGYGYFFSGRLLERD